MLAISLILGWRAAASTVTSCPGSPSRGGQRDHPGLVRREPPAEPQRGGGRGIHRRASGDGMGRWRSSRDRPRARWRRQDPWSGCPGSVRRWPSC